MLNNTDGFIIDLVGDEVVALYPPGFFGSEHARKSVLAVEQLIRLSVLVPGAGTQLQLGVAANTGVAYIGTVTGAQAGIEEVRALGDQVNVPARLASVAQPGEALLSEATCRASVLNLDLLERRTLEIKGRVAPFEVRVLRRS